MDSKKISFIMCTNDDLYASEAMYFINSINVPDGYSIEVLTIKDAKSMTAGYNEGMEASDAKYKVYMHQDVMIIDRNFISHILNVFQDESVGMIGMVGSPILPENKVMWCGARVGQIYSNNVYSTNLVNYGVVNGDYTHVEAVDGMLMATQYDIRWRQDIFDKWDFYDVSQSMEFRRAGYKVVVPNMEKPWCIHDDGFMNLDNYYDERRKLLDKYMLVDINIQTHEDIEREEQEKLIWREKYEPYLRKAYGLAKELLVTKAPQAKQKLLDFFDNKEVVAALTEVNDFAYMIVMMEIYSLETEAGVKRTVFDWTDSFQGVMDIIRQIKFLLWEIEFLDDINSVQLLLGYMKDVGVSMQALEYIIYIGSYDKQKIVAALS